MVFATITLCFFFVSIWLHVRYTGPRDCGALCANTNWISPLQKQLLQYILCDTMYYFFSVRSKLGSWWSIVMHSMRSFAVLWFDTMKVYLPTHGNMAEEKRKRKDERAGERTEKSEFLRTHCRHRHDGKMWIHRLIRRKTNLKKRIRPGHINGTQSIDLTVYFIVHINETYKQQQILQACILYWCCAAV